MCTQEDGDICSSNNGGCSAGARCISNTAISPTYRDCLCPAGTTGTGFGLGGCTPVTGDSSVMSCSSRPCQNGGTCIPYRDGVYCTCPSTFSGTFCEVQLVNACSSNPCQNGAACVNVAGGYRYAFLKILHTCSTYCFCLCTAVSAPKSLMVEIAKALGLIADLKSWTLKLAFFLTQLQMKLLPPTT